MKGDGFEKTNVEVSGFCITKRLDQEFAEEEFQGWN